MVCDVHRRETAATFLRAIVAESRRGCPSPAPEARPLSIQRGKEGTGVLPPFGGAQGFGSITATSLWNDKDKWKGDNRGEGCALKDWGGRFCTIAKY